MKVAERDDLQINRRRRSIANPTAMIGESPGQPLVYQSLKHRR
jgi:hypothetical protein